MDSKIKSEYVEVEGTKVHYLAAGTGKVILLIHGFPTSSYLWRNIIATVSQGYHVIAIDLPGYGYSDKKIKDSYSFRYYEKIISGLHKQLNLQEITLGVHDLGGPIGLYWMVQNMEKVERLILFNTVVYSKFSWAVKLFGLSTVIPILREWVSSPSGVKKAMKFGVHHKEKMTKEMIEKYQEPFQEKSAGKVLLKTVQRLSLKGFKEVEEKLFAFKGPVQIIYGEKDRILPEVSETMKKVKKEFPKAQVLSLPNAAHFLQEDAPGEVSHCILEFMSKHDS